MAHIEFEKLLKEADALASKGKYNEATEAYMLALEQEPMNPQANRQLIQVLLKSEQYDALYERFIKWAELLCYMEKWDDAQKVLQEAANMDSSSGKRLTLVDKKMGLTPAHKEAHLRFSPKLYFLQGKLAYDKLKSFDEAIACLIKSLEYDGANADAHCLLGLVYLEKGMDEKAKGEFQEVVRLAPENAALAYEKLADISVRQGKAVQNIVVFFKHAADIYQKKDQQDEALRIYQNILHYEPENKDILNNVGEILVAKGLISDAVQIFKHLAQIYSNEGLFDRVILLYDKLLEWESDNIEIRNKVIEMYRSGLKIDPSNLRARHKLIENLIKKGSSEEVIPEFLALITTYLDKGLVQDAIMYCRQLMELDPNNLKAIALLADLELKTGNKANATTIYLDLIKKLEELGRIEEANKVTENLLAVIPANEDIYMRLGEEHLSKGHNEEAFSCFQAAYDLNNKNMFALTYVGEVLQRKGENDKAQLVFEKVLQENADFGPAKERLSMIYEQIGDPIKIRETLEHAVTSFIEQQNFIGAIPLLRKLLMLFPEELSFHLALFAALMGSGSLDEARIELLLLTRLLIKRELTIKAIELLQQYLEKAPLDINFRAYLAKTSMEFGSLNIAANEYLNLANCFIERHLPQKAIQMYRNLIILEPVNFVYHKYLGQLLVEDGKIEEALAHYLALEEQYEQQKMPKDAKEILNQILKLDPFNRDAAMKSANLSFAEGAIDEAIIILTDSAAQAQANNEQRSVIILYEKIASIYQEAGIKNKALETLLFISELYFNNGNETEGLNILKNLAAQYLENADITNYKQCVQKLLSRPQYSENKEAALSLYKEAIVSLLPVEPPQALILINETIQLLLETGQLEYLTKFAMDVENNLKDKQGIIIFYNKMAEIEIQLYRLEDSIKYYVKVIELNPSDVEIYVKLAKLYVSKEQISEACDAYISALELYISSNMLDKAQEIVSQVEKLAHNSAEFLTKIGELFTKYNQWNYAKSIYEKALQNDDNFIPALLGMANTLAKTNHSDELAALIRTLVPKGCVAEVLEEYKKLLLSSTANPGQMILTLGNLYWELGFHEEAIQEFSEAIKDPACFLEGIHLLGLFFAEQGFLDLGIRQMQQGLRLEYSDEELLSLRYSLADLYEQGHLFKEATDLYNEIYALDIRYKDVETRLQLLNKRTQQEGDSKIVTFPPDKSEKI